MKKKYFCLIFMFLLSMGTLVSCGENESDVSSDSTDNKGTVAFVTDPTDANSNNNDNSELPIIWD